MDVNFPSPYYLCRHPFDTEDDVWQVIRGWLGVGVVNIDDMDGALRRMCIKGRGKGKPTLGNEFAELPHLLAQKPDKVLVIGHFCPRMEFALCTAGPAKRMQDLVSTMKARIPTSMMRDAPHV